METIAILAGGGPAPGINTVISTVAKVFMKQGYRVIGIHDGFKGLFSNNPQLVELNFARADRMFTRGGSVLQMSRYKPALNEFNTDIFIHENIKLLVTIGGDDTASTANRIAYYLKEQNIDIRNIHVPKTIDNDLPLPEGIPTFGFNSAKDEGARIAKTIYEDARTSQNWFVLAAMGRSAGHLAFEIGAACHYPMIIVPEMFNNTSITADGIARLVISSIIKRKILGLDYGAAIISEGVFHFMTDQEIKNTGANFTYDAHGHPELFNVSKAHVFNMHIQRTLRKLNLDIGTRPVELGFEIRCTQPIGYDLTLCSQLGLGVWKLFSAGHSRCLVSIDYTGATYPIYLEDVADEHGKIKPRLLNINNELVQNVINYNMHYITPADYTQAAQYLSNPEDFDFTKILKW